MRVELTTAELVQAAIVGVYRQATNLRDGRRDAHGAPTGPMAWGVHVEGAAAEAAVAKAMGVWWSGALGALRAPDAGRAQVRSTTREDGCLIVHPGDDADAPFVLLVGCAPRWRVAGWLAGAECKRPEWWRDPTGQGRFAFFVPQRALRAGLPTTEG